MKVTYPKSFKYRVEARIKALRSNAIVRADVAKLGSPRQVSRALKNLVKENKLVKLGYGTYGKLAISKFSPKPYLKGGFVPVVREALTKLKIKWEPSQEEKNYNDRRTTQIPVNPNTRLKKRCRRKLSYNGMEFKRG